MPGYKMDADDEALFPDEGEYSLVVIDLFKSTDDDEFIQKHHEFEDEEEVFFPPEKESYKYYIYADDGETYGRESWNAKIE